MSGVKSSPEKYRVSMSSIKHTDQHVIHIDVSLQMVVHAETTKEKKKSEMYERKNILTLI